MMTDSRFVALAASLAFFSTTGCGDDQPAPFEELDAAGGDTGAADAGGDAGVDGGVDTAPFAFTGEYDTNFGSFYRFTETGVWASYIGAPAVVVSQYNNAERWLVGQNSAADAFNPSKWSRFDFAEVNGDLFVCQSAFGADTEEDAVATPAADATDPATGGCSSFAWTALTEGQGPLPLIGSWLDNFGQSHEVAAEQWVIADAYTYEIEGFDNSAGQVLALNGEGNAEATGRYSRFDWAESDGNLYYCQIAFDAESIEAAEAVDPADVTGVTTDGCNGFPWSELIAVAPE